MSKLYTVTIITNSLTRCICVLQKWDRGNTHYISFKLTTSHFYI